MNLAAGTEAITIGTVVAGRYRVIEVLGRGGMGVVYRVEHAHTGEELALKVLLGTARFDPQSVSRFKREARATARIRSDHVVRVTDADTAPELGDMPFIVMELLYGSDLERHVCDHGPLAPDTLVAALTQVGRALEIAHGIGVVHRDLKPENLFLHRPPSGPPVAKVLDFGISKFVTAEGVFETANMTSTGSVLGTPLYMAPEQAHGQNDKIAPTTDIWAMGLVAMRLLTGESYWGMPTMADLMMKLVVKPMIPPSERWPGGRYMSPALDAWFAKSCAREQAQRFTSVEQQTKELAEALGVSAATAASPSALESLVPPPPVPSGAPEDVALAATTPLESGPPRTTPAPIETVPERPSFVETTVSTNDAGSLTSSHVVATPLAAEHDRSSRDPKASGRTTRFAVIGALASLALGSAVFASARSTSLGGTVTDPAPPPPPSTAVAVLAPIISPGPSPVVSATPAVDAGEVASATATALAQRPVLRPRPATGPRRPVASAASAAPAAPSATATASSLFAPLSP